MNSDRVIHRIFGSEAVGCRASVSRSGEPAAPNAGSLPVILAEEDFEPWLWNEAGLEVIKPAPEDRFALKATVNDPEAARRYGPNLDNVYCAKSRSIRSPRRRAPETSAGS
jgi:hypothetical protein